MAVKITLGRLSDGMTYALPGMPSKLRAYAVLWRDGVDVRTQFKSPGGYYKVRAKLLEHGIDIGTPCNVLALTRHTRIVEVAPVSALREIAEAA